MKKLNLFFPQWQDSGTTNELYFGAQKVKNLFGSNFNFVDIKVLKSEKLKTQKGILGYKSIVSQFKERTNYTLWV